MPEIDISCACPGCTQQFLTVDTAPGQTGEQLRARYKTQVYRCYCTTCGCTYVTEDDTVAASSGGSIQLRDAHFNIA